MGDLESALEVRDLADRIGDVALCKRAAELLSERAATGVQHAAAYILHGCCQGVVACCTLRPRRAARSFMDTLWRTSSPTIMRVFRLMMIAVLLWHVFSLERHGMCDFTSPWAEQHRRAWADEARALKPEKPSSALEHTKNKIREALAKDKRLPHQCVLVGSCALA
jgi:hypothetical protein